MKKFFRMYFLGMGLYDIVLGCGFVLFFEKIYTYFYITLPNHPGYIYVPGLFLVCAGIGEALIAKDLIKNVDLALVRLLMKLSFIGAVVYCNFSAGIPFIYIYISMASILGVVINTIFIGWARRQA